MSMKKWALPGLVAACITAVCVLAMLLVPVPTPHQAPECCDQYTLETAYGFPLHFKELYSGGFSGQGEVVLRPSNVAIDAVICGAVVLLATLVVVRHYTNSRTNRN